METGWAIGYGDSIIGCVIVGIGSVGDDQSVEFSPSLSSSLALSLFFTLGSRGPLGISILQLVGRIIRNPRALLCHTHEREAGANAGMSRQNPPEGGNSTQLNSKSSRSIIFHSDDLGAYSMASPYR